MAKGGRGGQARGGNRAASNNKRPAQRKYDTADGTISDDEVDAFHNSRDRVALRGFDSKQREKTLLDQDDEELMELDMSEEDSEEELQMVPVPRSKYDESDSENNGADDDEKMTSAWGRKKSIFYSADTVDAGDSAEDADAMAEEEQEAVRLQNKMLAGAREDDFDDMAMMPVKQTKGKKKNAEGAMLDGMNKDLDSIAVNIDGDSQIETVKRDISSLTKSQKLQLLMETAPELAPLAEDLSLKWGEVTNELLPVLALLKQKKLAAAHGFDYLQHRLHLLLHYCTLASFYLLLRCEEHQRGDGMSKQHPCLEQIVKTKALIDALEVMQEKIAPQVTILLEGDAEDPEVLDELRDILGLNGDDSEEEAEEDSEEDSEQDSEQDDELEDSEGDVQSEDASEEEFEQPASKSLKRKTYDMVDEDSEEEMQDYENDESDQQHDSEEVSDEEHSDEDIEAEDELESRMLSMRKSAHGSSRQDESSEIVTSLKRQVQKQLLGNVNPILMRAQAKSKAGQKSNDMSSKVRGMMDDEDLLDERESNKKSKEKSKQLRRVEYADEGDEDDSLKVYNQFAQQRDEERSDKKSAKMDKKQEAIDNWADPYDLREGARRSAGRGIVSNRGLMPYRKKDVRNPRVHMRHKYEKAMTKRRALVREYKGKDDQYAGEKTGIKTNVSRSVKLK